ncbi:hypothetical protein A0H81_12599 [Grifola frondosa]|uniref:Uncharacterized protein n=1 Tax=Grifola frondosa TaxID=5627 RepID=A0A1C7LS03_GRIFR|nr:hypothetical protein A0H81_12599 [Grifola frondosa]
MFHHGTADAKFRPSYWTLSVGLEAFLRFTVGTLSPGGLKFWTSIYLQTTITTYHGRCSPTIATVLQSTKPIIT